MLCVDFGIFPNHLNFDEIKSIYHNASPLIIPQPEHAEGAPQPRQAHMPVHMLDSPSKKPLFFGRRFGDV